MDDETSGDETSGDETSGDDAASGATDEGDWQSVCDSFVST